MNENLVNDLLNNDELKEKITMVQSKEEFLELLKEYSVPLTTEKESEFLNENKTISESSFVELEDVKLEEVSGGVIDIFDLIYERMYTFCLCKPCGKGGYVHGFWIGCDLECPKCHKETYHGKMIRFF